MFFSVHTLGCKLNQLETEAITDSFRREGYAIVREETLSSEWAEQYRQTPGIFMINTCTVTSMAEQKARRIIRKLLREFPAACVIATGCYAQLDGAALAALEENPSGRLFVFPGEKKDRLMDLPGYLARSDMAGAAGPKRSMLPELLGGWPEASPDRQDSADGSFRFRPEMFSFHSRGFIKIQDGCDRRCSYCRVSLARGKSRSLEAREILSGLLSMEERGIAEAVLTGVNISQYRSFLPECPEANTPQASSGKPIKLPGLLEYLLGKTSRIRLRLSSLEPDEINGDLIGILANKRIRPHFHLSLQSGSAAVLEKMGRPYGPDQAAEAIELLRSAKEDPFLACDIIAGFPGEAEADFEETMRLCERARFAWIHAFPYSRRPGTAAYSFPRKVSEREAAKRAALLSGLARKGRAEYARRWEGRETEAIIEGGNAGQPSSGNLRGLSENYLRLKFRPDGKSPEASFQPGSLVKCRIVKAVDYGECGENARPGGIDAYAEITEKAPQEPTPQKKPCEHLSKLKKAL